MPVDDRNVVTLVAGLQPFTGDNVRTHVRATYADVVEANRGLSAQLRIRYFRSSEPGEFDYYSPCLYAEVLPVLQMRRFVGGWQLLRAVGYGAQRDSDSKWRSSRFVNARFTSPAVRKDWAVTGSLSLYQHAGHDREHLRLFPDEPGADEGFLTGAIARLGKAA